jgi:hypothetical protein
MTKKLILGSLVAAALIFTGCGDDDTPANGGTPGTESGGTTDNNTSGGTTDTTTVTVNGLTWTALIKYDDNDTISGKQTQTEAQARCQEISAELPTMAQLQAAAAELKPNTTFRAEAGEQVVVWFKDVDLHGYFFNGTDANTSSDTEDYTDSEWTAASTAYYTCVKQAQ